MLSDQIIDNLKQLANAKDAEQALYYFKTGEGEYSEGDRFLGIRMPILRAEVKKCLTLSLTEVRKLLASDFHEIRMFALLLLVKLYEKGDENTRGKIYRLCVKQHKHINNWDLVDSSVPYIHGHWLYQQTKIKQAILKEWAAAKSLWLRRTAIMATFYFIKQGDYQPTLRIAKQLLNDKEDLIRKAVGWMLREVGKRDLVCEETFLQQYSHSMPRTMLRYAIEKFEPAKRKIYLAKT